MLDNVLVYPRFKTNESSTSTLANKLGITQPYTCSQFAGCTLDANALLERLIRQLEAIATKNSFKKGLLNSLRVKLLGAKRALDKNHKNANKAALHKIRAFVQEVAAHRDRTISTGEDEPNEPHEPGDKILSKSIPEIDAKLLIDAANVLREMLDLEWRQIVCQDPNRRNQLCDK